MPRARNIKHELFRNEDLAELSFQARLLFIGLWTLADCKGRMEYRPRRINAEIFPYDQVDIEQELISLDKSGFISIYSVKEKQYIEVVNFEKHQNPHKNERAKGSNCPDPVKAPQVVDIKGIENDPDLSRSNQDKNHTDPADSLLLIPDSLSLIPDTNPSSDDDYSFKGERFKINPKDFAQHKKLYPNLNLLAEYAQLDVELRDVTPKQVWHMLNAKLNYRNKIKSKTASAFDLENKTYESGDL
jgi:hypothetical protein